MKAQVKKCFEESEVKVNEHVHERLSETFHAQLQGKLEDMPPMKRLFIEQQLKVLSCKSNKGMRWHPAMVRWCLALRQKSRSAYEYIRSTSSSLPSNKTLDDYAHYREVGAGIDVVGLENLAKLHANESVAILCDEMKVKDGLVYDINTGALVGYIDIDIDSDFEEIPKAKLATHVLVFMVRGLKSNFKLAAATFATTTATAEQIFLRFRELVGVVELVGLKARVFVGDGAATNRKFLAYHQTDYGDEITFRARNKFCDDRIMYFASDVPHLLKTTRNNWENSGWNRNSRKLTLGGKQILLGDLVNLYEEMSLSANDTFTTLYKLTNSHIRLTSFARMKVSYAAQVLSKSVANSLRMKNQPRYSSLIQFIEMFNNVFDILNIRYRGEGDRTKNKWKMPVTSADDWRFEWIEKEFLGWLSNWEDEVSKQPDMTREQRDRFLLSRPTRDEWRITCLTFLHLTPELLDTEFDYVLTEKLLCQDSVEQYFAAQRAATGSNNAPTLKEVHASTRLMTVISEVTTPIRGGNCSSLPQQKTIVVSDAPMDKHQRKPKKIYDV